MAGTYTIQPHSENTPQAQSEHKTSFYVQFFASNNTASGVQFYEVDSSEQTEIHSALQQAADGYDALILSQPVVGAVVGL